MGQTTVYGDVLVIINFTVNLALLKLTQRMLALKIKLWRQYLGAMLSALCAFAVFLPDGIFIETAVRLVSSLLAVVPVYISFGKKSVFKALIIYYSLGAAFAGIIYGVLNLINFKKAFYYNGAMYFNIPPVIFALAITFAYAGVSLMERIFFKSSVPLVKTAYLRRGSRLVSGKCLLDSGNLLCEPFSGLPIVAGTKSFCSNILTEEERNFIICGEKEPVPAGIRPVIYTGAGGRKEIMYAVKIDEFYFEGGEKRQCYLGICQGENFASADMAAGTRLF